MAEEGGRAEFAVLDDQTALVPCRESFPPPEPGCILRQQLCFAVVDQQSVEAVKNALQVLGDDR